MLWMPPPEHPRWDWEWLDESVHLTLFGGLGGLATLAGGSTRFVLLGCLTWAMVTEVVQGWLPWPRTPELGDIVADMIGALIGWAIGTKLVGWGSPNEDASDREVGGVGRNGRDSNPR
jgi:VanZ family protein